MHRNKVFIITTTLPQTFGGRTKSLLERGRILAESGLDVSVCSTNHNDNYQDIFTSYRSRALVTRTMALRNMFEDFSGFSSELEGTVELFCRREFGHGSRYLGKHRANNHELKSGGDAVVTYADIGRHQLKFIDYIPLRAPEYRVRAHINSRQNVTRLQYFDSSAGNPVYQEYLDSSATPYIRYVTKDGKKFFAFLNSRGAAGPLLPFKRLIAQYLEGLVSDGDAVINDARGLDYSLRLVQVPVRKIYVMHNPHLVDPLRLDSGIKNSFRGILRSEGLKENETVVSLTEEQRNSVLTYVPKLKANIVVIGHVGTPVRLRVRFGKTPKRVGIVGRLDEQKNLTDAILAFEIFRSQNAGYVLDVYGKGKQEAALKKLVRDRGLEKEVFFRGFTENVNAAFQSVAFTLNTSFYEGFPLAVIESISNGTPVASYPVNFGPERILGGVAGRVSAERTPFSLAKEMEVLARNPLKRRAVRKRSMQFSREEFSAKWLRVLDIH